MLESKVISELREKLYEARFMSVIDIDTLYLICESTVEMTD